MRALKILVQHILQIQKSFSCLGGLLSSLFPPSIEYILIDSCGGFDTSFVLWVFRHTKPLHNKGRSVLIDLTTPEISGEMDLFQFVLVAAERLGREKVVGLWLDA